MFSYGLLFFHSFCTDILGTKMALFLEVKWRCPSSASIHQCTVRHDSPGPEELIQGCHDGDSDIHFEPMSNMDLFGDMIYYSIILTQQKLCPQVDRSFCHVDFHYFTHPEASPRRRCFRSWFMWNGVFGILSRWGRVKWVRFFLGKWFCNFENQGWRCVIIVICILKKVEIIEWIMYRH